ncbi:MAG: histidine--tRNA ligase [Anaerolineales bacterium]
MNKIVPSVKGTRDFYPEQMALRTWLYDSLREISESFGYQEYEGPFLEMLELYAAKSGEELVKEQSYVFEDRGGSLIALRPELTPTLARMVAQKQRELTYPNRWWSFGPFWRYEKPQKGRSREFFQWNIDMMGVNTPQADAEMIGIAASFFRKVGLEPTDTRIYVNDRRLMEKQFDRIGLSNALKQSVSNLVDKRSKLSPNEWSDYALEMGLSQSQLSVLKDVLDNKDLWHESDEMKQLFSSIDAMGFSDYVEFDPNIVRGLLYYTGTVFEAFDTSGSVRRSILGGGRYDNLLADVGGEPLPCTGFAMGDVVISLILQEKGLVPTFDVSPAQVLVTVFSDELSDQSQALSAELRSKGIDVNCFPEAIKLNKQFKFADRMGMRLVMVIGPEEITNGQVAIKDLAIGTQEVVDRKKIAVKVKDLLA